MAKITPNTSRTSATGRVQQTVKTQSSSQVNQGYNWWLAKSQKDRLMQLLSTASFLKDQQMYRYRSAGINSRLYGNVPLANFIGSNLNKMTAPGNGLPIDRPTMNVVQSCVDTLVSRITQSKPRPVFLTDNGDYKERNLSKQLNSFIVGELYQAKAYQLGELILRDAAVLGTGCIKIYETSDHKVGLERVMLTELLVDPNDAYYGDPRTLYQFKLIDRAVLAEANPEYRSEIAKAENAFPDNSSDSSRTVADQIIIVEAWHLPSGKNAGDGRHTIATTAGLICDEEYKKDKFPFVFLHYSSRLSGFWGQSLSEQLTGTQVEINKLLMTISAAINIVGVPRVFVEDGSRVVKAHLNNNVGSIVTYRGTKPEYEVAPCVPQELYGQLERLVGYAYQQSGISSMSAGAQKPAGLNSGEAIRNYDDLQSDRFASLSKRYDDVYVQLAYLITDKATDIAEEQGSYSTVYPNKNGTKEIDLPASKLIDNPYVIQCFDSSSLPRDPAGRLQKITEMMQSNIITPDEGRRLLDFPDIDQVDKLANAAEERILQVLDDIVENGKYTPPDSFMNIQLATQLCTQYYNLYVPAKLEQSKVEMLEQFAIQLQALVQAATPTPPPMAPAQAVPAARPVSDTLPNAPAQAA